MRLLSLYIFVLLILGTSVQAREEFWYVGAGGGATFLNDKDDAFDSIDEKSTVIKAYVGYRASTYIALEVEYAYLGEYDYQILPLEEKAEYSALSASIVVVYPLIWDDIELFTPVGVCVVDADYGYDDKTTGGYKLGFGVAYTPTKHFTMRVGAEVFVFDIESNDVDYKQNLVSTYAAIQYNF